MTTYAELQAQIKKLQEQAEQVKAKELETVVADIKKKISEYGLTAEQLGFSSATGKTSKKAATKESTVMYKKGDQTWSGAIRNNLWTDREFSDIDIQYNRTSYL